MFESLMELPDLLKKEREANRALVENKDRIFTDRALGAELLKTSIIASLGVAEGFIRVFKEASHNGAAFDIRLLPACLCFLESAKKRLNSIIDTAARAALGVINAEEDKILSNPSSGFPLGSHSFHAHQG